MGHDDPVSKYIFDESKTLAEAMDTGKKHPFITVAVPTYRREEVLCDTILDLLSQDYPRYEIVVVDQVPDHEPETSRFLTSVRDRVGYIVQDEPNLPLARNRSVQEAAGEIIVFVDDDVRLGGDFLWAHARNYELRDVHAVAGSVLENLEEQQRDIPPQRGYYLGRAYLNYDSRNRGDVNGGRGCNMSFRREVFELVGLFDPRLPAPYLREDTDLFIRMNRQQLRIIYDPQAVVRHVRAQTGGTATLKVAPESKKRRVPWLRYESYLCETVFQLKHFSVLMFPLFLAYSLLGWVVARNITRPRDMLISGGMLFRGVIDGIRYHRKNYAGDGGASSARLG